MYAKDGMRDIFSGGLGSKLLTINPKSLAHASKLSAVARSQSLRSKTAKPQNPSTIHKTPLNPKVLNPQP